MGYSTICEVVFRIYVANAEGGQVDVEDGMKAQTVIKEGMW